MLADCKLNRILFTGSVLQAGDKGKQSRPGFQSNTAIFLKMRTAVIVPVVHLEFDESSSNPVTYDCSKLKLMTANGVVQPFFAHLCIFFVLVHRCLAFRHKFCFM